MEHEEILLALEKNKDIEFGIRHRTGEIEWGWKCAYYYIDCAPDGTLLDRKRILLEKGYCLFREVPIDYIRVPIQLTIYPNA